MFLSFPDDRRIIQGDFRIIGVTDDLYERILHGQNHGSGILFSGADAVAVVMDTGNSVIQSM